MRYRTVLLLGLGVFLAACNRTTDTSPAHLGLGLGDLRAADEIVVCCDPNNPVEKTIRLTNDGDERIHGILDFSDGLDVFPDEFDLEPGESIEVGVSAARCFTEPQSIDLEAWDETYSREYAQYTRNNPQESDETDEDYEAELEASIKGKSTDVHFDVRNECPGHDDNPGGGEVTDGPVTLRNANGDTAMFDWVPPFGWQLLEINGTRISIGLGVDKELVVAANVKATVAASGGGFPRVTVGDGQFGVEFTISGDQTSAVAVGNTLETDSGTVTVAGAPALDPSGDTKVLVLPRTGTTLDYEEIRKDGVRLGTVLSRTGGDATRGRFYDGSGGTFPFDIVVVESPYSALVLGSLPETSGTCDLSRDANLTDIILTPVAAYTKGTTSVRFEATGTFSNGDEHTVGYTATIDDARPGVTCDCSPYESDKHDLYVFSITGSPQNRTWDCRPVLPLGKDAAGNDTSLACTFVNTLDPTITWTSSVTSVAGVSFDDGTTLGVVTNDSAHNDRYTITGIRPGETDVDVLPVPDHPKNGYKTYISIGSDGFTSQDHTYRKMCEEPNSIVRGCTTVQFDTTAAYVDGDLVSPFLAFDETTGGIAVDAGAPKYFFTTNNGRCVLTSEFEIDGITYEPRYEATSTGAGQWTAFDLTDPPVLVDVPVDPDIGSLDLSVTVSTGAGAAARLTIGATLQIMLPAYGNPNSLANVAALPGSGSQTYTLTDDVYTIVANAPGWEPVTTDATVTAGQSSAATLQFTERTIPDDLEFSNVGAQTDKTYDAALSLPTILALTPLERMVVADDSVIPEPPLPGADDGPIAGVRWPSAGGFDGYPLGAGRALAFPVETVPELHGLSQTEVLAALAGAGTNTLVVADEPSSRYGAFTVPTPDHPAGLRPFDDATAAAAGALPFEAVALPRANPRETIEDMVALAARGHVRTMLGASKTRNLNELLGPLTLTPPASGIDEFLAMLRPGLDADGAPVANRHEHAGHVFVWNGFYVGLEIDADQDGTFETGVGDLVTDTDGKFDIRIVVTAATDTPGAANELVLYVGEDQHDFSFEMPFVQAFFGRAADITRVDKVVTIDRSGNKDEDVALCAYASGRTRAGVFFWGVANWILVDCDNDGQYK